MIFDFKQFKELYLNDAEENIQSLINTLLLLEKNPADTKLIDEMMRYAHNIKGASASVGFNVIAQYAHAIEDVFAAISRKDLVLNSSLIKTLFRAFDQLTAALTEVKNHDQEPMSIDLLDEIRKLTAQHDLASSAPSKPDTKPRVENELKISDAIHYFAIQDSIKVGVKKLDTLLSLSSNLIENKTNLSKLIHSLFETYKLENTDAVREVENFLRHFSSLSDQLQQEVLLMRLVPMQTLFSVLPRMVHDIAAKQNKTVNLFVEGADIEVDRLIVNQLTSPLFHLIRNAIDHGIVKDGIITVKASINSELLTLSVEDNGGGIDFKMLFDVVEKKKLVDDDTLLILRKLVPTEPGILPVPLRNLLCASTVSTSQQVTDVSGRGVGLTGVKNAVENIGGNLEIYTKQQGTAFVLKIPTNIALIKVIVARVDNHLFGIPLPVVVECIPFEHCSLSEDKTFCEISKKNIPFVNIEDVFGLSTEVAMPDIPLSKINPFASSLIIIQDAQDRFALKVDELLGDYEVMLKPLPIIGEDEKFFSGAALLYDGRIVLIVDIKTLEQKIMKL